MPNRTTGYRYGLDDQGNCWIVKLSAKNEQPGHRNEFISDDCICEKISNPQTGDDVKTTILRGVHGIPIEYTIGKKIEGGSVWFYKSKEDLCDDYLSIDKHGCLYKASFIAKHIDEIITSYGRTYEEVAIMMHISTAELKECVQTIKKGLGAKEDELSYMPILQTLQKMRKK